jgi:hypothetical protein
MKLPHPNQAQVDREKITEYLLSDTHPDGSAKARFFKKFGFRAEAWEILAAALRRHGSSHSVVKTVESAYGMRYTVEGEIETPDGRNPRIRTVWVVERNSTQPRLITAYPC